MRLMRLSSQSSPLFLLLSLTIIISIIVPPSLPPLLLPPRSLLCFFPWSEIRSATALTHTHDETE